MNVLALSAQITPGSCCVCAQWWGHWSPCWSHLTLCFGFYSQPSGLLSLTACVSQRVCEVLDTGSAFVCALSPCELVACHDLPATGETPMHKSPGGDPKLTWDFNFIGSVLSAHCAADAGLINTHARETRAHLFSDLCSLYVQVHAVLCQRKMTTWLMWYFPIVSSLGFLRAGGTRTGSSLPFGYLWTF